MKEEEEGESVDERGDGGNGLMNGILWRMAGLECVQRG